MYGLTPGRSSCATTVMLCRVGALVLVMAIADGSRRGLACSNVSAIGADGGGDCHSVHGSGCTVHRCRRADSGNVRLNPECRIELYRCMPFVCYCAAWHAWTTRCVETKWFRSHGRLSTSGGAVGIALISAASQPSALVRVSASARHRELPFTAPFVRSLAGMRSAVQCRPRSVSGTRRSAHTPSRRKGLRRALRRFR